MLKILLIILGILISIPSLILVYLGVKLFIYRKITRKQLLDMLYSSRPITEEERRSLIKALDTIDEVERNQEKSGLKLVSNLKEERFLIEEILRRK